MTTVIAAVAVLAVMPVRLFVAAPFIWFFIAVTVASRYGGLGPGLVSISLASLAMYWLVSVERAGAIVGSMESVVLRFSLVGIIVVWLNDRLSHARAVQQEAIARLAAQNESLRSADRVREELLERERRARDEALAASERLAFLAEVSALLTSSLDYQETLDRAVHIALPRLGDWCNVVVEEDRTLRPVACGHVDRRKEPILRDMIRRITNDASGSPTIPAFYDAVMKSGKPMIVNHEAIERARAQASAIDPELFELGDELRPYAFIGVPLRVHGRTIGIISFASGEHDSRRDYGEADLPLVEEFARRVSPAIENARLFRRADDLNRLKDEFLAALSHELRTPLSAILGWARILAAGQLDAEGAARAVRTIERNAQAQSQIVDDILDLAHGRAGNLRLNLASVDLVGVARHGVEAIAPAAAAKHLDVKINAPDSVIVVGDAGRLQQVAWNLLSNAVKFTNPGGRIAVDIAADDGHATLRVTDTGIGISPAFLPFVFDKFRQADGSFTRQHGGLGLGLAITRHLVELHGGSIEAASEGEGNGATFLVRLPLAER